MVRADRRLRSTAVTLRGEQVEVPDVTDEDPAAVGHERQQPLDYLLEVELVREVLGHGVDDDGVELLVPPAPSGSVTERASPWARVTCDQRRPVSAPAPHSGQGGRGDVDGVDGFAGSGVAEQEQPRSAADLQEPAGPQLLDAADGAVDPLAHLVLGDGVPGVAAVPADQVQVALGGGGGRA